MAHIRIIYRNIGRRSLPAAHHVAAHLLAEVTGTAGCEGQRADIGMAGVKRRPQQHFTPLIHTLCGVEAGAGLGGQQALIHHPTGNPNVSKRKVQNKGKGPWVRAIQDPVTNSFLLGWGVLSRTQTCMDAGLCCRHGGRGGEVIIGPGGLLGTCSCQLCTNSPTSSVTFPAGKTSIIDEVGGQQG